MKVLALSRTPLLILLLLLLAVGFLLGGSLAPAQAALPPIFDWSPSVVSVSPADGATEVSLDANIHVDFNKAVTGVSDSSFTLTYRLLILPLTSAALPFDPLIRTVDAVVTLDADKEGATLNPVSPLEPGVRYTAHLTDDIGSLFLMTFYELNDAPYTWSFTTVTRPEITSRIPAAASTNVPLDQQVSVGFSKSVTGVNSDSVYLKETASGTKVTAAVEYNALLRLAKLTPVAALKPNTSYTVTVTSAVKSTAGSLSLLNAPVTWQFTTGAGAPTVIATDPADGATDVPLNKVVKATFSTAMDAATIKTASFFVKKSGGTALAASVTYSAATQTASLDPSADLEYDTTYIVTLTDAVEGTTGDALADAPVTWSFTTEEEPTEPPVGFTDVDEEHPYYTAIMELAERGIILGKGGGLFGPNDPVTRQQFAKMIVKSLGIVVTGSEVCPFTDVQTQVGDDPFYPSKYVAICAREEITKGYNATTFGAADFIKHQQLITMVVRAAILSDPPAGFMVTFTPGQFSLQEHYLNAKKAAYAGLLNELLGIGPSYDFLGASTRGECAHILYNLIVLRES